MKQSYEFPRVSTRGYYDLNTGDQVKFNNPYFLYPKKKFDKIFKSDEVVIFVHGMQNTRKGAVMGGQRLRRTLRKLGYRKHPVVSFSYDADIRGAYQINKEDYDVKLYHKLISRANKIARHNGKKHLTAFIHELKEHNPNIKIHLVGHSLGCNVIEYVNESVESIHLLGSPVEWDEVIDMGIRRIAKKIVNYYNPTDAVIQEGVTNNNLDQPSCLHKVKYKPSNIYLRNCKAVHHGFRAYADKLRKFP